MSSAETKERDNGNRKKPSNNAFQQQRLRAWQPLLTPSWVIGTFTIVGIVFIILGIIIKDASDQVVQIEQRYDNDPDCLPFRSNCTMRLKVPAKMEAPVYFYYKLTKFYQNHRRYVKSRSDSQLQGQDKPRLSTCEPLETWNFNPSDPDSKPESLYPCGLIANSMFNDSFTAAKCEGGRNCSLLTVGGEWREDGIAWKSDIEKKFIETDQNITVSPLTGYQLDSVTNEHFIVWMRTAGLPTFKKLYARLPDTSFEEGDEIELTFTNYFQTSSFGGEKYIIFTTLSWLGGKNEFLAYSYIVVGAVCLVLALGFFAKHKISPRELGDMQYFNWPTAGAGGASPSGQ